MIFHNLDLKLILKKLYLKLETNHDKNNVYLDDPTPLTWAGPVSQSRLTLIPAVRVLWVKIALAMQFCYRRDLESKRFTQN